MRPFAFRRRYLAVLLLVIAAALLLWQTFSSGAARRVKLPDGRQLTIHQLTYGTNHQFVYGSFWSRMAATVLPPKWKARTGVQTYMQRSDFPALMIWGEWQLPRGAHPAPMVIIKDDGASARETATGMWMGVPASGRLLMGWMLQNFPRRTRPLRFEVGEWNSRSQVQDVASFKLPSAAPRRFPIWKPSPYPMIRQTNGCEFGMLNFCRGRFVADPWLTIMPHLRLGTGYVAVFQVKRDGIPAPEWTLRRIKISDATGNAISSRFEPCLSIGDNLVMGLGGALWSTERAWRFETQFVQTTGYRSNELCVFTGISVPPLGATTQIVVRAEANGLSFSGLKLQHFGGSQPVFRLHATLEVTPLYGEASTEHAITLVEVTDDLGRKLRHGRSYYNLDGVRFGIELLPDSHSLNLTLAAPIPVNTAFMGGLSAIVQSDNR